MEKRHNYVRKVAEFATQFFITDNRCNCVGLVMAGSADFKNELMSSDLFDPRLLKHVVKTVDVSYGGESGFNQAIELSSEALGNVKLVQEKRLLQKYFDEITQDTGKYCFMIEDTLKGLDLGAVETLIVWENLDVNRITLRNNTTREEKILHLTPEQERNDSHFRDPETGVELEVIDKIALVEWIANNYKGFGAVLEFVTNRSQEGSQFCRGFGGIGGLLRWQVDFAQLDDAVFEQDNDDWDNDMDGF
jgi:peptide chain release factor subunit 1